MDLTCCEEWLALNQSDGRGPFKVNHFFDREGAKSEQQKPQAIEIESRSSFGGKCEQTRKRKPALSMNLTEKGCKNGPPPWRIRPDVRHSHWGWHSAKTASQMSDRWETVHTFFFFFLHKLPYLFALLWDFVQTTVPDCMRQTVIKVRSVKKKNQQG